jgi:hypothetical protein
MINESELDDDISNLKIQKKEYFNQINNELCIIIKDIEGVKKELDEGKINIKEVFSKIRKSLKETSEKTQKLHKGSSILY